MNIYRLPCYLSILFTLVCSLPVFADNQLIDKVYHPYVLANEREFEIRTFSRSDNNANELSRRIGYGFSLNEHIAVEAYVIGDRDINGNFGFRSYEGEMRWMLTEQGQYFVDAGFLFELERDNTNGVWASTSGLLLEKEFGKTSLTGNFFLLYNSDKFVEHTFSTQVRMQYRYRLIPEIQPAVELYRSDDFVGLGPAFLGEKKFSPYQRLKWEAALIVGFNGDRRDHTFRFSLEYEF